MIVKTQRRSELMEDCGMTEWLAVKWEGSSGNGTTRTQRGHRVESIADPTFKFPNKGIRIMT